jgi:hypothetical protein
MQLAVARELSSLEQPVRHYVSVLFTSDTSEKNEEGCGFLIGILSYVIRLHKKQRTSLSPGFVFETYVILYQLREKKAVHRVQRMRTRMIVKQELHADNIHMER